MTDVQQASVLLAGGAILFAVAWFVAKHVIGNMVTAWAVRRLKKRGWGRK